MVFRDQAGMLSSNVEISSAVLLAVSCVSLLTVSLLILCLCLKTKSSRAKTMTGSSEEDSANDAMLVRQDSNPTKRGVKISADDIFYDDRGHYDLIGPDAPIVRQSASMKTFNPARGPTGGQASTRVNDAGYETLPVDEPYDVTYSTINEKSSKSKSGFQVDGNALYSLIDDVIPNNKSMDTKSAKSRDNSHNLIPNRNTDSFPIYSVVNKSPPAAGEPTSTFHPFSIEEPENKPRKKKTKSKKKIDFGDCHEDDSTPTSKDTVIPIYSLVVRTKSQRDQNMPELTSEQENNEEVDDQINSEVGNKNTDSYCINNNNTKDRSKKKKTKVLKPSLEKSIDVKDISNNCGREIFNDDGGYELLPDHIEGEVFGLDIGHPVSGKTSCKKSGQEIKFNGTTGAQRLSLTLPASAEEPGRCSSKGGRRRSRSEQEMSRQSSLTSMPVKRCDSWAKCDLMQLPYQLATEIPVLYTTAV